MTDLPTQETTLKEHNTFGGELLDSTCIEPLSQSQKQTLVEGVGQPATSLTTFVLGCGECPELTQWLDG